MNHNHLITATIFQDRNLNDEVPVTTPLNSWKQLTQGDERAESFEGFLRLALIASILCSVFLCSWSLRPASDTQDSARLAMPSLHLPQIVEQGSAATVKAAF